MTKPKTDWKNEDEVHIRVHEMLHDLITVLNTQSREIGAMAMIELLVTNSVFNKQTLLDHVSRVWDAWNEEVKKDVESKTDL